MLQGPFCHRKGAWHSTTPRDAEQGQPPGPQLSIRSSKRQPRQGIPGDPREGGGKKKSKMMFSFPTQLMELYSKRSDKTFLGSCCPGRVQPSWATSPTSPVWKAHVYPPTSSKVLGLGLGPPWNPFSEAILTRALSSSHTLQLPLPGPGKTSKRQG